MRRNLTNLEKNWILESLTQEDSLSPYERNEFIKQLPKLHVTEHCDCGDPKCPDVMFNTYQSGTSYAVAQGTINQGEKDEFVVIVFVNIETNLLSEIEVVN